MGHGPVQQVAIRVLVPISGGKDGSQGKILSVLKELSAIGSWSNGRRRPSVW